MRKVSLIGAGNIGGTMAQMIAEQSLAEVMLYDVVTDVPQGKALDLSQSQPISGADMRIRGSNDPESIAGSDVVIITAGRRRTPDMSRDDLVEANTKVIQSVAKMIKDHCPQAFVICVTNPLDVMVGVLQSQSQLPHHRVVGMAGILDSSRLRYFIAEALGVSLSEVDGFVLGGHGDTMVPLLRYTTVSGVPVREFCARGLITEQQLEAIVVRTRNGGGEIGRLLKTMSAFYAPAAAAVQMAKSYLLDQKRILPCAAWCDGVYGLDGLYLGVPVVIGANGVEKVIELDLNEEEREMLAISITAVRKLNAVAAKFL